MKKSYCYILTILIGDNNVYIFLNLTIHTESTMAGVAFSMLSIACQILSTKGPNVGELAQARGAAPRYSFKPSTQYEPFDLVDKIQKAKYLHFELSLKRSVVKT